MRPFADERWWPLFLFLGGSAVLVALAFALMSRRDVGAGIVAARPGPRARLPSWCVRSASRCGSSAGC